MNPKNRSTSSISIVRLCVLMVALAIATMCLSLGTVAKYATSDSTQDSAHVAKFGVRVSASDESSFKTEYTSSDNTITVKSSNGDRVVAPGTSDEKGLGFSIIGSPEVATKVDVSLNVSKDVFLKTKKDGKEYYYYPVKFTLTRNDEVVAEGNLETIQKALDDYSKVATYKAYTTLMSSFNLSWTWDYSSTDRDTDVWDTQLGDIAAGIKPAGFVDGEDYSLDIEYSISVSVYQVD